ncbi:MAG: type II toxin-antitoxin system PemK/MazF family toxin [Cytophagales bacterium]|nr:type II toxin-antitoxin system PemK/MazF family toxin [Cytophagales bacterium]
MEKGDLILIPFPFTDLTGNKTRPTLVLAFGKLDVTVAFVSTQLKWKEETDILLESNEETGLKKNSLIRLSKIATIDKNMALGRLGVISNSLIQKVNENLKAILDLD